MPRSRRRHAKRRTRAVNRHQRKRTQRITHRHKPARKEHRRKRTKRRNRGKGGAPPEKRAAGQGWQAEQEQEFEAAEKEGEKVAQKAMNDWLDVVFQNNLQSRERVSKTLGEWGFNTLQELVFFLDGKNEEEIKVGLNKDEGVKVLIPLYAEDAQTLANALVKTEEYKVLRMLNQLGITLVGRRSTVERLLSPLVKAKIDTKEKLDAYLGNSPGSEHAALRNLGILPVQRKILIQAAEAAKKTSPAEASGAQRALDIRSFEVLRNRVARNIMGYKQEWNPQYTAGHDTQFPHGLVKSVIATIHDASEYHAESLAKQAAWDAVVEDDYGEVVPRDESANRGPKPEMEKSNKHFVKSLSEGENAALKNSQGVTNPALVRVKLCLIVGLASICGKYATCSAYAPTPCPERWQISGNKAVRCKNRLGIAQNFGAMGIGREREELYKERDQYSTTCQTGMLSMGGKNSCAEAYHVFAVALATELSQGGTARRKNVPVADIKGAFLEVSEQPAVEALLLDLNREISRYGEERKLLSRALAMANLPQAAEEGVGGTYKPEKKKSASWF